MSSGIYEIRCALTGKCYVGSAVNLRARWATHRHGLRKQRNPSVKLQRAWDKYGASSFGFRVLLYCAPKNLLTYEQLAIDALKPELNTRAIASSNLGLSWGLETRAGKPNSRGAHTVQGVTDTIPCLAKHFGVASKHMALDRVAKGWDVEAAVLTPPASRAARCAMATSAAAKANSEALTFRGETGNLRQLAEKFSPVSYNTVKNRYRTWEWPLERALLGTRYGSDGG